MTLAVPAVAPAVVLSVIVGALYTCVYVLLRGRLRLHVLLVLPAAIAGAWIGQAVGSRIGDPFRLGDFSLTWATLGSWAGIGLVAVSAMIVRPATAPAPGQPQDMEDA
jgi:hypothetical protein